MEIEKNSDILLRKIDFDRVVENSIKKEIPPEKFTEFLPLYVKIGRFFDPKLLEEAGE